MKTSAQDVIGRVPELRHLDSAIAAARSSGQAIFLVGEAGIGKSRLAAECVARATDTPGRADGGRTGAADRASRPGPVVMRGRANSAGIPMPFRPLVEALSSRFRDSAFPAADELVPYRPALARLMPQWRTSAPEVPRPEALVELSEALLRLLTSVSEQAGCLLVLEDLHDADPETAAVIEYLIDNLAGRRILVLVTLRPESGPALDLVTAAERRGTASAVRLRALPPDDVRGMAASCLRISRDELPDEVGEHLVRVAGGNPYLIEVLLTNLIEAGTLRRAGSGWQLVGRFDLSVPDPVVDGYARRLGRLPVVTRDVLLTAAVLGERFRLVDLRAATGLDESTLLGELRTASREHFITPDPHTPDGYVFRHALTVEALVATMHPAEHAAIARSAAAAISAIDPALPGERCHLVARLFAAAGEPGRAAPLYADAGRRALASGAASSAVSLLRHGLDVAGEPDRPAILASFVQALADNGQLDLALRTLETQPAEILAGIDIDQAIALRTRLAWAAVSLGRYEEAARQVDQWQLRFGALATPQHTAGLAVVRAHLSLLGGADSGRDGRSHQAEALAVEAAAMAERADLPELACQAWQILALATRRDEFDLAAGYHERMRTVAERHGLALWRADALLRLAGNEFMCTGSAAQLQQVTRFTRELGALALEQAAEGALAMAHVLRAEPEAAQRIIDRCLDTTVRMRLSDAHRYLLLISAIIPAHRGRRREMNSALAVFWRASVGSTFMTPLALGLGQAICALLEEDRELAVTALSAVDEWESRNPAVHCTTGRFGLGLLLAAVRGELDLAEHGDRVRNPAARLLWNAQFALLAEAVLLGRAGQPERAGQAVAAAGAAGANFPTAWHLGLRLAAESALTDGWGDPVAWLGEAEQYFHAADVPSVASACRMLLRGAGVRPGQRRRGVDQIPAELRALGVTVREHEVLLLMADKPSNQEIARRLFISPRTAEKHVASLIDKVGVTDRSRLCDVAAGLGAGVPQSISHRPDR